MSSVKHKYRFYVDDIRVYPVWSNNANLKWTREGEFVFLRLKLNGTFTLVNGVRKDFNLVWAQDLDHEFTFRAEYIVDGVIEETINGTFYKTDCPLWDIDNERVDVVVNTIDRYELLMKAFDKEFDLVGILQPETYAVNYKKDPLIQIAFPYHQTLYNRVGTSSFLTELPTTYSSVQLEAFGFIHEAVVRVYIPGTADMTPDVSGIYEQTGATQYERTDGMYRISRVEITRWTITDIAAATIVYRGIDGSTNMLDRNPFTTTPDTILESVADPGVSYCAPFPIWAHQRILTDATTVGGNATIAITQPDIGDIVFAYDRYIDMSGGLYIDVTPSDIHTTTPTKFGKYNEDAQHFADEYFDPPTEITVIVLGTPYFILAYPLMQPSWTEFALTEYVSVSYNNDMMEAATDVVLRDAYALADVIKLLLAQIDPAIYFEATAFASKFFFDTTNPITLEAQALTHFITPKSNIIISDYSQPDTKEMITFGNIDNLLKAANLFWWIDNVGNFRIEHIAYFKNGRSYTFATPFVGVDLTTLLEPRTGKYWGYNTNKFRYTKEKMPEQFIFGWMDKQSEYFDGFPIKINSGFVEKGLIPDMKVQKFSSDLSLAVAFPDNFAVDGFFVMGAEFSGGEWTVPFEEFNVGGFTNVLVQNGFWTFYYLHDKFWRHNLPSPDANINNVDITAITTKRGKEQSLIFPAGVNPDPMRLITSGIGNCEIEEMEISLATRKCTIKALGDLDFDNPCPTC